MFFFEDPKSICCNFSAALKKNYLGQVWYEISQCQDNLKIVLQNVSADTSSKPPKFCLCKNSPSLHSTKCKNH
ncbi:hypothetical protein BpHYR1_015798 [Brachionus plicatilis]|uniref:Uncharacterized protein n=1 Tax=Brachionus plicatilis TaxID=10195 RepID=A0A3M7T3J9_BRAPC|nr:hypothetical protein BpHYR1_015798 [Brachionus plicatilis]